MQLMLVLCLSVFDVVRVLSECTCEKRSQKSVFKEADLGEFKEWTDQLTVILVSKVRFHSVEEEGNGDLSLKPLYEQVFKPKNVNETLNGAILMNASLADCNHIMMNEDYLVGGTVEVINAITRISCFS